MENTPPKKRMNSLTGKKILELIRNGNYAHPGEEEAIELVLSKIDLKPEYVILDVGCGRGGTCDYIRKKGFKNITGIDIDENTIHDARTNYPEINFLNKNVLEIANIFKNTFDFIYHLTSFYAFNDQAIALKELHKVLRDDGTVVIFDYADPKGLFKSNDLAKELFHYWTPINFDSFTKMAKEACFNITDSINCDEYFENAYQSLLNKIISKKENIANEFGIEWYDYIYRNYYSILDLTEKGVLGGILVILKK